MDYTKLAQYLRAVPNDMVEKAEEDFSDQGYKKVKPSKAKELYIQRTQEDLKNLGSEIDRYNTGVMKDYAVGTAKGIAPGVAAGATGAAAGALAANKGITGLGKILKSPKFLAAAGAAGLLGGAMSGIPEHAEERATKRHREISPEAKNYLLKGRATQSITAGRSIFNPEMENNMTYFAKKSSENKANNVYQKLVD